MKSLKKFMTSFIWLFIVCAILSSCSDEEDPVNKVEEGLPVSISFGLTTPAPNEVKTRATDEQETQVERLMLFFYKDDISNPVTYEVPDMAACKVDKQTTGQGTESTTNYFYNITVPKEAGVTSGKWYVYAIANWHKGFWGGINEGLQWPLTRPELKELLIQKKNDDIDFTETSMLLTGKYGTVNAAEEEQLTLSGENGGVNTLNVPIHLQRSLSKINVVFENGKDVEFVPESFDLYNYCKTSTLFERSGWTGVANPGTVTELANSNFVNRLGISIKSHENPEGVQQYGFEFYMPENVQKAKADPTSQALREKKEGDTFTYAPDKATYMVVHGRYKGPSTTTGGEVTANVDYILHLGDFSSANVENGQQIFNNFTVRRNTKYNFKVTVNGVDNIITEAKATSESPNEPQPGAEGDVMNTGEAKPVIFDAHYQTQIFDIDPDLAKQADKFSVLLRTPKTGGNIITKSVEELQTKDITWIKFCRADEVNEGIIWDRYAIKYKKYPQDGEGLMDIAQLLTAMRKQASYNEGGVLAPSKLDGRIYIQVFVDEYFYQDLAKKNRYDEFINADRRVLTMATGTKVSLDGKSTYTEKPIFSFEQRSIKTMYDLSPSKFASEPGYNPFGIETEEDKTRDNQIKMYLNSTSKTAGEGDDFSGASISDGFTNCTGVDGGIIGQPWDKYVDFPNNRMKSEYDYGLYHFLLRNRDTNGDGTIQKDEIKWYMPSFNQHIAIWNGYHALPQQALLDKAMHYFSSTQQVYRTLWAYEGAFGYYKPNDKTGNNAEHLEAVRCIRALRNITGETTQSTVFDYGNRIFSVSNFGENAVRPAGSQQGDYPYHTQIDAANKLPSQFEVAKDYLPTQYSAEQIKAGNVCAEYTQEEGGKDKGSWRMPNQRELMVMLLIWNNKEAVKDNFVTELRVGTASSTYYNYVHGNVVEGAENRVFFIEQNRNSKKLFVTSTPLGGSKYWILPVRDVK